MKRVVVGLDIGGTAIKCGVVNSSGALEAFVVRPTPSGDPALVVMEAAALLHQLQEHHEVKAVGVACPGAVNADTGVVCDAGNLGWGVVPLRSLLEQRLQLPVRIENDAQAALLAEWRSGVCTQAEHAVYITLGTGIGGALLLGGRPYRGQHNAGAEIGHIITHAGGELCSCGLRGCYEVYGSAQALVRRACAAGLAGEGARLTARQVVDSAKRGDHLMSEVFEGYLEEVCVGLLSLISVFYPQLIVLGGGLSEAGNFLLDGITGCLGRQEAYTKYYSDVRIALSHHGNRAGVLGAAALWEETEYETGR